MTRRLIPCCLVLAGLLGACESQQGMYHWGEYEPRLYDYYKDPDDLEPLMADLETTLAAGEKDQRVPPGLYAEYGYFLMTKKRHDEAITYFTKEKTAWPESTVLMDKMIGFADSSRQRTELEGERGPGS
jgi:hypothetical protein